MFSFFTKRKPEPIPEPEVSPVITESKPRPLRSTGKTTPGIKKTTFIQFRATPEERAALKIMASERHTSVAALCLSILDTPPQKQTKRRRPAPEQLALLGEINRIGNNINQIARWCNSHASGADVLQVAVALSNIERELKKCTSNT